jgi:hypothetical protein
LAHLEREFTTTRRMAVVSVGLLIGAVGILSAWEARSRDDGSSTPAASLQHDAEVRRNAQDLLQGLARRDDFVEALEAFQSALERQGVRVSDDAMAEALEEAAETLVRAAEPKCKREAEAADALLAAGRTLHALTQNYPDTQAATRAKEALEATKLVVYDGRVFPEGTFILSGIPVLR